MKAYINETNNIIEPFNDHPRDWLIENRFLSTIQKNNLSSLGIEYVHISNQETLDEDDEYISFDDSLYFTKELLNEFITRSRQKKGCTVCALKSGITTQRTVTNVQNIKKTPDYIAYNLYYFPEKKFREESSPIVIDPDKLESGIPMPKHMCGSDIYQK